MDLEELIPKLCERPGMYVGKNDFTSAVIYLDGFDHGFEEGIKQTASEPQNAKPPRVMRQFTYWLYTECFPLDRFGSNEHYLRYLCEIFPDDADKFQVLPVLFREFKAAEREAGGTDELAKIINDSLLSFDEYMNVAEENEEPSEAEEEKLHLKQLEFTRAAMCGVLAAAARGEERPLATHITHIQARRAEEKARAAALLKAAQEMHK